MKAPDPKPPKHLRPETRRWWLETATKWVLEGHHLHLLTLAGEALDRAQQAREAILKDGAFFAPPNGGAPKKHPGIAVERDSMIAFARLVRELDLDGSPQPDARPPRLAGRT